MPTPPRRRWYQFSLKGLLIVMAVLAIPLGWIAYQLNWIRQRHELLQRAKGYKELFAEASAISPRLTPAPTPKAPGLLWLFGEEGQFSVTFTFTSDEGYLPTGLADYEETEVERAKELFPEATINWRNYQNRTVFSRRL